MLRRADRPPARPADPRGGRDRSPTTPSCTASAGATRSICSRSPTGIRRRSPRRSARAGGAHRAGLPARVRRRGGRRPLDLAAAAAELDTALEALDEVVAAGLVHKAGPRRYRFRRPIVRRAVYGTAGEGWRLEAHERAAAHTDGPAKARHLEHCAKRGDEQAVATLVEGADFRPFRHRRALVCRRAAARPGRPAPDPGRPRPLARRHRPRRQGARRPHRGAHAGPRERRAGGRRCHVRAPAGPARHRRRPARRRAAVRAGARRTLRRRLHGARRTSRERRRGGDGPGPRRGRGGARRPGPGLARRERDRQDRAVRSRKEPARGVSTSASPICSPSATRTASATCAGSRAATGCRRGSRSRRRSSAAVASTRRWRWPRRRWPPRARSATSRSSDGHSPPRPRPWSPTGDRERALASAEDAAVIAGRLDPSIITVTVHALLAPVFLKAGRPERCLEQARLAGMRPEPSRRASISAAVARALALVGVRRRKRRCLSSPKRRLRGSRVMIPEANVLIARSLAASDAGEAAELARRAVSAPPTPR